MILSKPVRLIAAPHRGSSGFLPSTGAEPSASPTSLYLLLVLIMAVGEPSLAQAPRSKIRFSHHFIATSMHSGDSWGFGTPGLADLDRDGDLDFLFGVKERNIDWFEFRSADEWERHPLGKLPLQVLGAATADVDGDGWIDVVTGGFWYRNSQRPRDEPFTLHRYDALVTSRSSVHDVVVVDMNGDGHHQVMMTGDGIGCYWYQIPDSQKVSKSWPRTTVSLKVLTSQDSIHAGFFPRGVADLDGDGDVDIVLPDRWLENQDAGHTWKSYGLPFGKRGPYGLSARSWIVDLDQDGDNDIVMTDSDQQESRIAWLENNGKQPPTFTRHLLPESIEGKRGSFHSLIVADFDNDHDLDVFTAEQEDPDILPVGASPKWFVWENLGTRPPSFREHVVLDQRLGGHDALAGDVDGDGDIDICAKIWSRWSGNSNGGTEHAIFLENLAK